ncbi:hypothetical protein PENSPDRAFT_758548 [Peniophora sp. CONT]|nr:hypothetical protein PENSPDRAFT_758548 [Peniophora sp. CONT]
MTNDDAVRVSLDMHEYAVWLCRCGYIAPNDVETILEILPFKKSTRSATSQIHDLNILSPRDGDAIMIFDGPYDNKHWRWVSLAGREGWALNRYLKPTPAFDMLLDPMPEAATKQASSSKRAAPGSSRDHTSTTVKGTSRSHNRKAPKREIQCDREAQPDRWRQSPCESTYSLTYPGDASLPAQEPLNGPSSYYESSPFHFVPDRRSCAGENSHGGATTSGRDANAMQAEASRQTIHPQTRSEPQLIGDIGSRHPKRRVQDVAQEDDDRSTRTVKRARLEDDTAEAAEGLLQMRDAERMEAGPAVRAES